MSRNRKTRAPDIDVLAGHYLSRGLSKHPEIAKHVENLDDLEKMSLYSLLTVAKTMGVDADAMIRVTEQQENELMRYSMTHPAFRGELECDLTFTLLGKSVTRKAKVVYEHTPEWEYWDLNKKAPFKGWNGSSWHLEVAAVTEEYDEDENPFAGTPYWVHLDDIAKIDVLPHEFWDHVLDEVDEKCKVEDAERRAAALVRASPKSKRRH